LLIPELLLFISAHASEFTVTILPLDLTSVHFFPENIPKPNVKEALRKVVSDLKFMMTKIEINIRKILHAVF
jgi:hypothetical protein